VERLITNYCLIELETGSLKRAVYSMDKAQFCTLAYQTEGLVDYVERVECFVTPDDRARVLTETLDHAIRLTSLFQERADEYSGGQFCISHTPAPVIPMPGRVSPTDTSVDEQYSGHCTQA